MESPESDRPAPRPASSPARAPKRHPASSPPADRRLSRLLRSAVAALSRTGDGSEEDLARCRQYVRELGYRAACEGRSIHRVADQIARPMRRLLTSGSADLAVVGRITFVQEVFQAVIEGYLNGVVVPSGDATDNLHLLRLLQEERRRLAGELHDEVGQILTAILYKVQLSLADLPAGQDVTLAHLRDLEETLHSAIRDFRRLVYNLEPPMLVELGLVPAIRWLAGHCEEQFAIPVTVSAPESLHLPNTLEGALFRIVQEALTNVARHARASAVRVELRSVNNQMICTVVDNGRGFNIHDLARTGPMGLGLRGMRARARQFRGDLRILSVPGQGTTVQVIVPLQGEVGELYQGSAG